MNIKALWLFFFAFFYSVNTSAQPKNDWTGEYTGNKKFMNQKLLFLGNGKVRINDEIDGEFFYENDSLFVFRNSETSIYKIDKSSITGLSKWEKNNTLKLKKNSNSQINLIEMENPRANWLKRFYKINDELKVEKYNNLQDLVEAYKTMDIENQELCNEGFDLACIQNFSFIAHLLMNENQLENIDFNHLKDIAEKVIALGNSDGYGLMYSYFVMNDQENLGEHYLEQGLELGSQLCLKLSIEKMQNQE